MNLQAASGTKAFVPNESNTRLLRDAFGRFATGVTIVTTNSDKGPVAITANSFSSVSLTPPLVLWSPDKTARRFSYFEHAEHYAIHILASEQNELCWKVAKDGFALNDLGLRPNDEGVPVLDGCLARFDCTRKAVYEGGDHAIVLGHVNRAIMRESGDALAFFNGKLGQFTAH